MRRLFLAALLAAVACDREPDPGNTCQTVCELFEPGAGKIGTVCDVCPPVTRDTPCDPVSIPTVDTSPPNDYGGCYCTVDGACPPGWQPHR